MFSLFPLGAIMVFADFDYQSGIADFRDRATISDLVWLWHGVENNRSHVNDFFPSPARFTMDYAELQSSGYIWGR